MPEHQLSERHVFSFVDIQTRDGKRRVKGIADYTAYIVVIRRNSVYSLEGIYGRKGKSVAVAASRFLKKTGETVNSVMELSDYFGVWIVVVGEKLGLTVFRVASVLDKRSLLR